MLVLYRLYTDRHSNFGSRVTLLVHPLSINVVGVGSLDASRETVSVALIGVLLLSLTLISANRSLLKV